MTATKLAIAEAIVIIILLVIIFKPVDQTEIADLQAKEAFVNSEEERLDKQILKNKALNDSLAVLVSTYQNSIKVRQIEANAATKATEMNIQKIQSISLDSLAIYITNQKWPE